MKKYKLGILGVGKMGGAILKGIVSRNVFDKEEILLCVRRNSQKEELADRNYNVTTSKAELFRDSEIVLLALKPQVLLDELEESQIPAVISIAAGIKIKALEKYFPNAVIIRAMPNTPAMIGSSVTTVASNNEESDYFKLAMDIFYSMGTAYKIPEELMDASLPLNGSMPAYLYYFAKCFIDKAVSEGIDYETARLLTADSIKASAEMIINSEESIEKLITDVCSKKGTTVAGLCKLSEGGFKASIEACFTACEERSRELGK